MRLNKGDNMLVLMRRINEEIRLGSDVQLKILNVHGRKVKLGICAPEDTAVNREEVYNSIKQAMLYEIEK